MEDVRRHYWLGEDGTREVPPPTVTLYARCQAVTMFGLDFISLHHGSWRFAVVLFYVQYFVIQSVKEGQTVPMQSNGLKVSKHNKMLLKTF